MQYRSTSSSSMASFKSQSSSSSSFASWLEQQKADNNANLGGSSKDDDEESGSFFGFSSVWTQFSSIQDSFVGQMQELSGSLPDAGPLSSAYRARLMNAIYLLVASVGFGTLAIVVGLPTLVVRPSKFVLCLTLCTLCATGSVIVMQKPTVFLQDMLTGGVSKKLPVALVILSALFTFYVTVFIHRYVMILVAGGIQVLCLLFYLASFIPGGIRGLQVILRMAYAVISTAMKPCLYVTQKTVMMAIRSICYHRSKR